MRYSRQIIIPEFGSNGQRALNESAVLIVGAGGLGSPAAVYLAAAGVGKIGIIDDDNIEASNLHRQVWFQEGDVGKLKVETLSNYISGQNSEIEIIQYPVRLDKENVVSIFQDYDIIVDGSDNFPTRYLVNDACVSLGKTLVFGAIYQFEGQISVFNMNGPKGSGINYRDIFPDMPSENSVPNCSEGGVIGVLPGLIATMMATEVIKIITKIGDVLDGYLLSVDAKSMDFLKVKIRKSFDNNSININTANYNYSCESTKSEIMKTINIKEYKTILANGTPHQLIDVREVHEFEEASMGGQLMPMSEIHKHVNDIEDDIMVIVQCRSGARSASVIDYLTKEHGFDNLYNLEGGILAWLDDK